MPLLKILTLPRILAKSIDYLVSIFRIIQWLTLPSTQHISRYVLFNDFRKRFNRSSKCKVLEDSILVDCENIQIWIKKFRHLVSPFIVGRGIMCSISTPTNSISSAATTTRSNSTTIT
ncbi:hypothetical protein ACTFIU_009457 [Dictyostelium citrinum]